MGTETGRRRVEIGCGSHGQEAVAGGLPWEGESRAAAERAVEQEGLSRRKEQRLQRCGRSLVYAGTWSSLVWLEPWAEGR